MDINDSVIVKEFLLKKTTSKRTAKTYRSFLKKYFNILEVENIDNYFKSNRDYTKDVWTLAIAVNKFAPKTQKTLIACVKKFLERYDVELKSREWEDIKVRNNLKNVKPVTQKRTPNNNDLKSILSYGGIKTRALFTFVSSTGMRIAEVLSLTFSDINMDTRHVRIRGEIAKGGKPRDAFFSEEAKELFERWLPERERLLLTHYKKSGFVRDELKRKGYTLKQVKGEWSVYEKGKQVSKEELVSNESRLFPYGYNNAVEMWHRLLEDAGDHYSKKDNGRYMYNIHSLRRFWFTQLESAGANMYHINYMGGHESELNATYTDFELRDLKKSYDEKMNFLSIFSEMKDVEKVITPKLIEQETQISVLSREYQKVSSDFEQFKKLVYYSIGVPPYSDEQLRQRKDLEGFLPQVTEEELKFINAFRDRPYKKKSKATQS